jgi:hypothetical protein
LDVSLAVAAITAGRGLERPRPGMLAPRSPQMSQKRQDDQDKSASAIPEVAAEIVPSASPVVMITSADQGVYVADQRLTSGPRRRCSR